MTKRPLITIDEVTVETITKQVSWFTLSYKKQRYGEREGLTVNSAIFQTFGIKHSLLISIILYSRVCTKNVANFSIEKEILKVAYKRRKRQ